MIKSSTFLHTFFTVLVKIIVLTTIIFPVSLFAQTSICFSLESEAEQYISSGAFDLGSSDLELGLDNNNPQIIGLRYTGINIPANASVSNATIQFTADETSSGLCDLTIVGEFAANAAPLSETTAFNISDRVTTNNSINWQPFQWIAGNRSSFQLTPDLSIILNEIISNNGFASGNAIAFIISGSGRRTALNSPIELCVTYDVCGTPNQPCDDGDFCTLNDTWDNNCGCIGIPDVDSDNDGVCDNIDTCPNSATNDSDNDGVCDDIDICLPGDDNIDIDNDSIPDDCDSCIDVNQNNICDNVDPQLIGKIVINEVNYRSIEIQSNIDFIEIYNADSIAIDLTGWFFTDAINYNFPAGTIVNPADYLVIAADPAECEAKLNFSGALGPYTGNLSGDEDNVILRNENFFIADKVDYKSWDEWPAVRYDDYETSEAIPYSPIDTVYFESVKYKVAKSIQKINPNLDGRHGGSWLANNPTPMVQNTVFENNYMNLPVIEKVSKSPNNPTSGTNVVIKAAFSDFENYANILSVKLEYQAMAAGSYIAKSDAAYQTNWIAVAMSDNSFGADSLANDGIYTATIPASVQVHRNLIRYRVKVTTANGYSKIYPDQNHTESNYAYYVYDGDADFNGYSFANLNPLQNITVVTKDTMAEQYIGNGTNNITQYLGYDYLGEGTLVYNGDVYDHIRFRPRGRTRQTRVKPGIKFDLNDEHKIEVIDDCGDAYKTKRDKLVLSGAWVNDASSHGLVENIVYKILKLTKGMFKYCDYSNLRIVSGLNNCESNHVIFEGADIVSYGGDQDAGLSYVRDSKRTILVTRNAWKAIPFNYQVTPSTVLQFKFRSTVQGEEHAIGLHNNLNETGNRFVIYGTQTGSGANQNYNNYDGSGEYKSYTIPVGEFFTGAMNYLFFTMENDVSINVGNSFFNDVLVFEDYNGNGRNDDCTPVPDPTGSNDFWGIYLIQEDYNGELLEEHNLPDGNIWATYLPIGAPRFMNVDSYGDFSGSTTQNEWFPPDSTAIRTVLVPDVATLDKRTFYGDRVANEIWANGERNYVGKHSYREYYNPETGKWIGWCKDYDGAFGSGNDVQAISTTNDFSYDTIVRHPMTMPPSLKIEYQSYLRSAYDLLLNTEQSNFLVDQETKMIYDPTNSYDWTTLDYSRWNDTIVYGEGNVDAQFQWYKDWFVGRSAYLSSDDSLGFNDNRIPNKPTITLTGSAALDNLKFSNSGFTDPQGNNTFAAFEWRVGEWSDPSNAYYISKCKAKYEIEDYWLSGEINNFTNNFTIPADAKLKVGESYKVRVRYKDNTGRWSHWSDAHSFIAQPAINQNNADIVINEINYNPAETCGSEFIEIYNNESNTVNLNNYSFSSGIDYEFPAGSSIGANSYLVLAKDSIEFTQKYGFAPFGDYGSSLSNSGELLVLQGPYNTVTNSLTYADDPPWNVLADGTGATLSLANPTLNNTLASYWTASNDLCGTPGSENNICSNFQINSAVYDVSCNSNNDGFINVSASNGQPPYTYSWNNGSTSSLISNLAPGNYNVLITDKFLCTSVDNYTINEPSAIQANLSKTDETLFQANDGTAALNVIGGVGPYTYTWSNGANTNSVNSLAPGTYSVTIRDYIGCSIVETFTINGIICTALNLNFTSSDESYYQTNDGAASVNISNGTPPYSYSWSNGDTISSISNLTPGNYSFSVTDSFGCPASENFTINPITCNVLNISSTITDESYYQANDGSVNLSVVNGTPPYSYSWSNGSTTQNQNNLAPNTYTVNVTDVFGCTQDKVLTVYGVLCNPLTTNINIVDDSCSGNGLLVISSITGGTSPYSILWSNGITGTVSNNLSAGDYDLTITDSQGCPFEQTYTVNNTTNISDAITILPASSITATDGGIDLTVTGGLAPYTYNWSDGSTTEDLNNVAVGTYSVVITDANNCAKTVNNIIINVDTCQPQIVQNSQPIITTGLYRVSNYIESNAIIDNTENVSFKAGGYIELINDFEVKQGAEFEAIIENCP